MIHKPGARHAGFTYGDLESQAAHRSPTLKSTVLERRRVSTSIDARGFRETNPLDDAAILALGDSYVHGPTIGQGADVRESPRVDRRDAHLQPRRRHELARPAGAAARARADHHAAAPGAPPAVDDLRGQRPGGRLRSQAAVFGRPEAVSREPHFLRFVERLAGRTGFSTVNLADLMRPYAERELLYFRDDTHWNAHGNRVAAELIAQHALGR
jgi:hypothetical protein